MDAFDRHEDHVIVPFRRKLAYGMGAMGGIMNGVVQTNMLFYFTVIIGLDPVLFGWVLLVPRLWGAIIEPLMGHISDNFRSRYGRRRPFIVIGGPLCCLAGLAMYAVPGGLTAWWIFAWLLGFLLLRTTLDAVTYIPYSALGCELSTDYDERTRVFAVRDFVGQAMYLLTVPFFEFANKKSLFPTPKTGYLTLLSALAVLSPLGFFWTFFGTREEGEIQAQERISVLAAIKATLMNKPFLVLLAYSLFPAIMVAAVLPLGIMVNIYHVFGGDADAAGRMITYSGYVAAVTAFVSVLICRWLGTTIGKRNAVVTVLAFLASVQACSWFLYNPKYPWLMLLHIGLGNLASAIPLCSLAMTADVVDGEELRTGRRREGMYLGVRSFVGNVAGAAGSVWMGYCLRFAGFNEGIQTQAPATIRKIRLMYAFYPIPCIVIAILILLYYPLSERKVRAMREELEKRRRDDAS